MLVDENELVASASWSREAALRIHALLASALSDLVRELELEPRALSVELNQNPIGYISDASVVLISSRHRRAFVLAVGWSD